MTSKYEPIAVNLTFAGSGFLGIYHLGVASCLTKHGRGVLKRVKRYGGASAGALVASMLVTDQSKVKECVQFTYNLAREIKSKPLGSVRPPGKSIMKIIEDFLMTILPEDAHKKADGKLFISLTDMESKKNVLVSRYDSREELIQKYMDGGYTDNLPQFEDGETIRVSPFCGRQEISPSDKSGFGWFISTVNQDIQVNKNNAIRCVHALFPPKPTTLRSYYRQGYCDTVRFLKSANWFEGDEKEIITYETSI